MDDEITGYGGERPGAGRPPVPEWLKMKTISVRLPQYVLDAVDAMTSKEVNRSKLIRKALISDLSIKPPEEA